MVRDTDGDDVELSEAFKELCTKTYSDEEIENAVDVESLRIDNHVDKRITTTPYTGISDDGEERQVPPAREELKWLAGAIDGGTRVTVHVRVLDVREYDRDPAQVIVADETAATTVEIPDQMRPSGDEQPDPLDQFNPGDSVLIRDLDAVEVRTNNHYSTLRYGFDADVEVWSEWDEPANVPVGVEVDAASRLVNDAERYAYEDAHVARERVVDTIVDEFDVMYVMDTEETWMYNGTAWVPGGESRLKSTLQEVLPSEVNTKRERNEIVEQVQLATQTDDNPFTPGPPDDPDLKWKVPVQNGLVDLREPADQEVEPHAPEHYTTLPEILAVEHDPDATADRIDANLEKIATDDVMKRTMEEMMANILMRNNDFRKAYINYGHEQTGKSFTDKLLQWLIGDDGIEHMSFTRFVSPDDDFETDASRNAYAVIDDDASGKSITPHQCSAFKRYVGTGGVRTGAKQVKRESHDPYATIKLNLNELPVWKAWDGSIQSRLMPLFYTQQFVASPDPDDPNEHQKKKESELERELRTDEELAGLLNQLIEAANRLYETSEWSIYENYYDDMPERDPEEAHDRHMQKYLNYADTTRRFARSFMINVDDAVEVRKEDWHTIYRRWCDEQGVEPQDTGPFWQQIRNDDTVYVEFKNPYKSPRVTKYVAPKKKALEYAPAPVKDRIEGLVEAPGFSVGVDETTPISDLPRGEYVTVEGEVVTKTMYGDAYSEEGQLSLVIEDESGGRISVLKPSLPEDAEILDEFDAALAGDVVRVHSGITSSSEPTIELQDGASSIKILERPDGRPSKQDGLDVHGDDSDESSVSESQDDRVTTVQDLVNEHEGDDGAQVDDVLDAAEKAGFDRSKAEHAIEKLKQKGEVYEIATDVLRATSGGEA